MFFKMYLILFSVCTVLEALLAKLDPNQVTSKFHGLFFFFSFFFFFFFKNKKIKGYFYFSSFPADFSLNWNFILWLSILCVINIINS